MSLEMSFDVGTISKRLPRVSQDYFWLSADSPRFVIILLVFLLPRGTPK